MNKIRRPSWLPVVAGIIKKDKKVLLGLRPENKSLAGLWEFPGGKIELGENPEQALKRELQEELGIDCDVGPLTVVTTHNYGDVGVIIVFYEVNFWRGEPKPIYHSDLKWVTTDELKKTPLPDANKLVLDRIIQCIG